MGWFILAERQEGREGVVQRGLTKSHLQTKRRLKGEGGCVAILPHARVGAVGEGSLFLLASINSCT